MENFLKHLLDSVNEDEKLDLTKKEDVEKRENTKILYF